MNAFGKRNGLGGAGQRPSFGVARPMKGGSGAAEEFAPGTMFRAKGFDSYAAYSLNDAGGSQLGLMAVMDRGPLPERELTEAFRAATARTVESDDLYERVARAIADRDDDRLVGAWVVLAAAAGAAA